MPDSATIKLIEEKIKFIEAQGFGEVIIKVKNGVAYRVVVSDDILLEQRGLDKRPK